MKKLILALLVCASGSAFANSACDTPRNDFDGLYCLNKVYQEADKELNANYKKLAARLDADGKQALKSGQLSWISERNQSCSKKDGSGFYVNLDCATTTTIKRAQFLQDRVRECSSSGCQNSKLN
ncbi:lysozyme inhibitor LprI family protein [Janthinobacterium sp.]|uniref:lysozyme inhibitor LprI family protein n=1 Tax=Janthinobacterium sp. TaxID=1871054 RepID=UPI00289A05BA|nr:lysozyme inhibitor LprI family protein [Janthinobacterium sp.]